ncbi:MAG: (2Fe-2S)-binding protein [Mycobacterium sp.]
MNDIPARPSGSAAELDGSTILAKTAELGDYFALPLAGEDDWVGEGGDEAEWLSLQTFFDRGVMGEFVARTREAVAESAHCESSSIATKMAASVFQLGVAARLLSPVVGAATCFGAMPLLDLRSVRWQPAPNHTPRFALTDVDWVATPTVSLAAAAISTSVLANVFAPLNENLRALTALSQKVTWGNVMSAANGAVTVLAMSQPHHEGHGRALVRALADTEQLTGTAIFASDTFTRRSCCLFYQAPGSGLCTDCVLAESDGSHRARR